VFGKIADGASMVWDSLDTRERILLVYGAVALLWLVAGALSMPRKDDDDVEPVTLPVVLQPIVVAVPAKGD